MKVRSRSALWLAACGIIGLASCSGKLHAGSEPSGAGGTATQSPDGPVVGAPAHCPLTRPSDGDACDVERGTCGYTDSETNYRECYCAESPNLDLRWFCLDRGVRSPDCPAAPVTAGKSCAGHADSRCAYPVGQQCSCGASATWSCFNVRRTDIPEAPVAPAPETPINALTEAERGAWCDWYELALHTPGAPPTEDAPVGEDGRVANGSCGFRNGAACNVAIPELSRGQCAQNLALSSCAAPVAALTDCLTTAQNGCVPEPHGCARLLASPDCNGTLVNDLGANGAATGGTSNLGGSAGASPGSNADPCSIRVQ